MEHIIALSGGKDSTALALRLAELEPRDDYQYVYTPTGDELPEMEDHWKRLATRLQVPLTTINSGLSLPGLIYAQKALPNWRMRWCTRMLKIEPFEQYIVAHSPCTVYIGIRSDETDREGVAYEQLGAITRRFPLVEWGWGLADVVAYLDQQHIEIPRRTDCGACFFQTLGEWCQLWQNYPERYACYEAWEAYVGHTLRSPQRDSQPAGLVDLRKRFEDGYAPQKRKMTDREVMCSVCAR